MLRESNALGRGAVGLDHVDGASTATQPPDIQERGFSLQSPHLYKGFHHAMVCRSHQAPPRATSFGEFTAPRLRGLVTHVVGGEVSPWSLGESD